LTFKDQDSGDLVLCAPSGDTASEVEKELAKYGLGMINWQVGHSLVSLIGSARAQSDLDKKALGVLGRSGVAIRYRDLQNCRSTFVVDENEAKKAVKTLYQALDSFM